MYDISIWFHIQSLAVLLVLLHLSYVIQAGVNDISWQQCRVHVYLHHSGIYFILSKRAHFVSIFYPLPLLNFKFSLVILNFICIERLYEFHLLFGFLRKSRLKWYKTKDHFESFRYLIRLFWKINLKNI